MAKTTIKIIWCLIIFLSAKASFATDFLITDFGAKPGKSALNTVPINKAVEACYENGGGRVVVPAGIFRTGTIILKDNVELYLQSGSTLSASIERNDFPLQPQPSF